MRALVFIALLQGACHKEQPAFGNRGDLDLSKCRVSADGAICDLVVKPGEGGCSCRGATTFHFDPAGNVDLFRVALTHCESHGPRSTLEMLLYLALRDHLPIGGATAARILEFPLREGGLRGQTHVVGDFVLELDWFADTFVRDGKIARQGTWSYVATVRKREVARPLPTSPVSELGSCHALRMEISPLITVTPQPSDVPSPRRFEIDRDLVSAENYELCEEAGACPPGHATEPSVDDLPMPDPLSGAVAADLLARGFSLATQRGAEQYCAWRGMRLPTTGQLQDAFYESAMPDSCSNGKVLVPPRCTFTTKSGVHATDMYEWGYESSQAVGLLGQHNEPTAKELVPETVFRCVADP